MGLLGSGSAYKAVHGGAKAMLGPRLHDRVSIPALTIFRKHSSDLFFAWDCPVAIPPHNYPVFWIWLYTVLN